MILLQILIFYCEVVVDRLIHRIVVNCCESESIVISSDSTVVSHFLTLEEQGITIGMKKGGLSLGQISNFE